MRNSAGMFDRLAKALEKTENKGWFFREQKLYNLQIAFRDVSDIVCNDAWFNKMSPPIMREYVGYANRVIAVFQSEFDYTKSKEFFYKGGTVLHSNLLSMHYVDVITVINSRIDFITECLAPNVPESSKKLVAAARG